MRFLAFLVLIALAALRPAAAQSERPATFTPNLSAFDYSVTTAMIPMRDGVKLKTVILRRNGLTRAPILLTRTPYGALARGAQMDATSYVYDAGATASSLDLPVVEGA